MLFLIVHYWEVMVDVWPAIVKVTVVTFLQINQRSRLSKSPLIFFQLVMQATRDYGITGVIEACLLFGFDPLPLVSFT